MKTTKKEKGLASSPVNVNGGNANSSSRRRGSDNSTSTDSGGSGGSEQAAVTDPLLPAGSYEDSSPSSSSGGSHMRAAPPRPRPDETVDGDGDVGEELLRSGPWVLRLGGGGASHPSKSNPCCWSYGRDDDNDDGWSIVSSSLLQVTHRPAHHAYPHHTNSTLYRRFNPTASAKVRHHHGDGGGAQKRDTRKCGECRKCRCGETCCSCCCGGRKPYLSATSSDSPEGIVREVYNHCDVASVQHLDENDLDDVDLTSKNIWPSGHGGAEILASDGDFRVKWRGVRVHLHRHLARRRRRRRRGGSVVSDEDDFVVDSSVDGPCDGAEEASERDALDITASSTTTTSASVVVPPAPVVKAEIELSPPPVRSTRATTSMSTPSGPGLTSRHPLLIPRSEGDEKKDGDDPQPASSRRRATADVIGRDDDDERDHDGEGGDDEEEVTVTFVLPRLCKIVQRDGPQDLEEEDVTDTLLSARGCGGPPPLLWRVTYPLDPALSIDSLTVFDGCIRTSSNSSTADDGGDDSCGGCCGGPPTHVYVNGWQSWSFAGAVPRGEPQPSSAMPDFLSRAFNFGGSLPPRPSSVVVGLGVSGAGGEDGGADDGVGRRDFVRGARRIRRGASRVGHRLFDAYPGEDVAHRAATATADAGNVDHEWTYKSDMFACITRNITPDEDDVLDSGISSSCTVGWLSQRKQFGLVAIDDSLTRCAMYCSCDGLVISDGGSQRHLDGPTRPPAEGNGAGRGSSSSGGGNAVVVTTDWAWCQIQPRDVDGRSDATPGPDPSRAPPLLSDQGAVGASNPTISSARDSDVDHEPMGEYMDAVARYNDASERAEVYTSPLSVGWCSWYHYYEHIDASTLVDNFSRMSKFRRGVGFNCCVVDDGYMTAWGDWNDLKPNKFDSGMRALADEMRRRGMRPGLWMAPFAADKHSKLAKEHPDWLIRNHVGRVANSSNCGKFFYGLDGTNPEVRAHAADVVRRAVEDWGYEVLKLDFLYGACLEGNGKFDLSMTRAETMYLSLRTLRDAAGPDVFLIGCGCPLGSAVGMVDGMRVSADTGPTWNPSFPLPWWDNSTLPCLRAMVRNSLTRSGMGYRWWHNDPDCLLLGKSTDLTEEEVVSAATVIAMTGGMLLLSDDLTALSAERFDVATRIYPITGATAVPLDLHCSFEAIPSLMRLWCTDRPVHSLSFDGGDDVDGDGRGSARGLGDGAFSPIARTMDEGDGGAPTRLPPPSPPSSPCRRNCIYVAHGLGSWSIVSMSNWLDTDAVVSVPLSSLLLPHFRPRNVGLDRGRTIDTATTIPTTTAMCNNGYHVFAFWSSKYVWIPPIPVVGGATSATTGRMTRTLSKRLCPHETEIFHLRAVSTRDDNLPQYIGSDLHFTCGHEVQSFVHATDRRSVVVTLKRYASCRPGSIFMYLPCRNVLELVVTVNGEPARVELVSTVPCGISLDTPDAAVAVLGCVVRVRIRAGGNALSAGDGGVGTKILVEF